MANSVDPDQTAPIGAVCSGSTLFASILKLVNNVRQLGSRQFQQTSFFRCIFLGALRVKKKCNIGEIMLELPNKLMC